MENLKYYDIFGQTQISFKETPHYETLDASGMPIFPDDCSITTDEFKLKYDEIEKDYSVNKLRLERNVLLKESDWVMVTDYNPPNKDEWVIYRQALRDLPQTQPNITTDNNGNLINPVFPTKPL